MPLKNYGVLVGRVVDRRAEPGHDTPHYQVHVTADGVDYRVAVNVMSSDQPPNLLYTAHEHFTHPLLEAIAPLGEGFHPLEPTSGSGAVDYIRANLIERAGMQIVPPDKPGPDNDLADKLEHYIQRALADRDARVFAFGQRWGPENNDPDKVFGFRPGNGVHDVHMNQGNDPDHARDDGVWQDGALLLHFPTTNVGAEPGGDRGAGGDGDERWVAIFLAFQTQAWHTDDTTGHALDQPGPRRGRPDGTRPGVDLEQRPVRIVAALVNPDGADPETEVITLLNASPVTVDLNGWSIVDNAGHTMPLGIASVPAGGVHQVAVSPPVHLGNHGGTITLLNSHGRKVDGVAYTGADADHEGWTLTF